MRKGGEVARALADFGGREIPEVCCRQPFETSKERSCLLLLHAMQLYSQATS